MSRVTFTVRSTLLPADETTPIRVYRQLRAYFSPSVLLESNNFEQARDTHSIIGVDPLLELQYSNGEFTRTYYPDAERSSLQLPDAAVVPHFTAQVASVDYVGDPGPIAGFFGFTSFDAYRFSEPKIEHCGAHDHVPDLHYFHFRFLLVFDHFHEQLEVIEFVAPGQAHLTDKLLQLLERPLPAAQSFGLTGEERSDLSDAAYEALVDQGKSHCELGDTFQLVLSRGYEQSFNGDDFNVYRQLRRLNPSPYGFYFDFGRYRMLGASPEALLTLQGERATMRPIAGTYPVTGDVEVDDRSAEALLSDPKENAEHRMLVDLARNDLSRCCYPVRVDFLRRIERYSHLMHIVSQVSGELEDSVSAYELYSKCFPAGTLSGAPKFKAIELIYQYEGKARGAYGGGLGYISPQGNFDHCIIIRSAVVVGNTLYYRAGAGIVAASDTVSEREEVTHKTNAIRQAIARAHEVVHSSLTNEMAA